MKRVLALAAPTANIQLVQGTGSTLIVTGTVTQATDIDIVMRTVVAVVGDPARVINALRLGGVQQVQMDVVIAHIARSEARSLGFSFLENGQQQFLANSLNPGSLTSALTSTLGTVSSALTSSPNIVFGNSGGSHAFLGFLDALRTENLAKLVAQPKVTTLSGQVAEFLSGGETAVPQIASRQLLARRSTVEQISGVTFCAADTKNQIPASGPWRRQNLPGPVEPEFTFLIPWTLSSTTLPGSSQPVFGRDTYRVKTSAYMEDGQTMAIGGMIFHQATCITNKVPVLGDMLSWRAFRHHQLSSRISARSW